MQSSNSKINVVIPMAGLGSRFSDAGYNMPKPLIDILGLPMIRWVYENIGLDSYSANFIFIVQQSHIEQYKVDQILSDMCPGCSIVALNGLTDGAARSVLYASNLIDNNNPLMIVNSDNMIEWNPDVAFDHFMNSDLDGMIITTYGEGPKWSYARVDSRGYAIEIAEKQQISNDATTGHYLWRRGSDFVASANKMIEKEIRYNKEFYVAPVYNQSIEQGLRIGIYPCDKFWSVGTPEDLDYFLENCNVSEVKKLKIV